MTARIAALLRRDRSEEPAEAPADGEDRSFHDMAARMRAFESMRAEDVMTQRSDIVALKADTPLGEAVRAFIEAGHSRLPVYRETLDEPLGMVHLKDLIRLLAPRAGEPGPADLAEQRVLESTLREVLYVPPSAPVLDLLRQMQARRIHLALVVDEFGGTDGLVTLEDLVEPIVGDIEDEHDEEEGPMIRARAPGIWEADARCGIEEFEQAVGEEIATEEEEEDVETLGGLVFTIAGRAPPPGETVLHPSGFEFTVTDSDPRRVKRLLVRRTAGPAAIAAAP